MKEIYKNYSIYSSMSGLGENDLSKDKFSVSEKFCLFILALNFILPLVWFSGVIYSYEVAMVLCLLFLRIDIRKYANLLPLIVLLFLPVCFERVFPSGSPSYDIRVSLAVFFKLSLFSFFLQSISIRCGNYNNAIWILRFIVLPVSVILACSALIDRYTSSTFFVDWHTFWKTSGQINYAFSQGVDSIDIDSARSRGFATRNTDIVSWSLLGLGTSYVLMKKCYLKAKVFVLFLLFFAFTAFSMPQRGALVSFGIVFIVLLLSNRTNIDRKWANIILVLSLFMIFVSSFFAYYYDMQSLGSNINAGDIEGRSALSRALNYGIVEDTRYEMMIAQLDDFSQNFRLLTIGAGWNFAAGVWSKPHNTYLAIIVGGGIISLIGISYSVFRLIHRTSGSLFSSSMGIALVFGVILDMFDNGMMYSGLEYPAGLLAMSILVITLIYIIDRP